jgi:2-desacetyl-2-hydroxyethyl bacteriochlorophyllide A dehydrogenase
LKSLICIQPGLFAYKEIAKPVVQKDHALLKIKRIGICGTDLHAYEGTQPYFSYPRILGHELAAEIAEVDTSTGFTIGETVTIIPYFNCGNCIACKNNKPNCCAFLKVCGVHIDGGMVEYLSVPDDALVHGNNLSLNTLALTEPLAIGAHAILRAAVNEGSFVLVIGAGPIGLAAMNFAAIAGADVIAMETNEKRLSVCKNVFGFTNIINAKDGNIKEQLMEITRGNMPEIVMDATGNLNAINNAFELMAHGGKFILVGLQKEKISFSHPEFHKREATVMSSRNATRKDFEYVIDCLERKLILPENFITHHTTFDKAKEEFPTWMNANNGVIKAIVEMN